MQNKYMKNLIYGFSTWLIPFFVGVLFYNREGKLSIDIFLFKSIMIVVGSAVGAFLLVKYFKTIYSNFVKEGMIIGFSWLILNIILDILILVPMSHMNLTDYVSQIAIRYITMPVMSVAVGKTLENSHSFN